MYRFLEHPSEMLVEVQAETTDEVFQDAATALFEAMTETESVEDRIRFEVRLEAAERSFLLIDWLNRLIYLHEVEDVFFSRFEVGTEKDPAGWKLSALVGGERIRQNHRRRSHVKSATWGQLQWIETPDGILARFVLDV